MVMYIYDSTVGDYVPIQFPMDSTPTEGSNRPITSDGVYKALVSKTYTVSIPEFTDEVLIYVPGIKETDYPIVDLYFPNITDIDATTSEWAKIYRITTENDQIRVYAKEPTSIDIPIILRVV